MKKYLMSFCSWIFLTVSCLFLPISSFAMKEGAITDKQTGLLDMPDLLLKQLLESVLKKNSHSGLSLELVSSMRRTNKALRDLFAQDSHKFLKEKMEGVFAQEYIQYPSELLNDVSSDFLMRLQVAWKVFFCFMQKRIVSLNRQSRRMLCGHIMI